MRNANQRLGHPLPNIRPATKPAFGLFGVDRESARRKVTFESEALTFIDPLQKDALRLDRSADTAAEVVQRRPSHAERVRAQNPHR
jgi:hypothetical protein